MGNIKIGQIYAQKHSPLVPYLFIVGVDSTYIAYKTTSTRKGERPYRATYRQFEAWLNSSTRASGVLLESPTVYSDYMKRLSVWVK
jgi:hypothetical protein